METDRRGRKVKSGSHLFILYFSLAHQSSTFLFLISLLPPSVLEQGDIQHCICGNSPYQNILSNGWLKLYDAIMQMIFWAIRGAAGVNPNTVVPLCLASPTLPPFTTLFLEAPTYCVYSRAGGVWKGTISSLNSITPNGAVITLQIPRNVCILMCVGWDV